MKISNLISDADRHYISNLIRSGAGELPNLNGRVSEKATHELILDKGFVVGAVKVIRGVNEDAIEKRKKQESDSEEHQDTD
jgi:hypothetical protein